MPGIAQMMIEMGADMARLRVDMNRATGLIDQSMKKIEGAAKMANKALSTLGVGLSVAALAGFIKNTINLADEIGKLAQKTGVAVDQIAGLQMSYKLAGMSQEKMESSLARLSKGMANNNKAFEAMGVQTRNLDGSLRPVREVLGDIADKFGGVHDAQGNAIKGMEGYADSAEKVALAQELFGISGAQMIVMLNGGSAALDEMDAMAKKYGLTISEEVAEQAAHFNDLLELMKKSAQGSAMTISSALVPTLNTLASEMLNTEKNTESLTTTADGLKVILKSVFTIASVGIKAITSLGKGIGALSAAIAALFRGDFSGADSIWNDFISSDVNSWKSEIDGIKKVWNEVGDAGVDAASKVAGAAKKVAPDLALPGKSAAKSLKGARDEAMELFQTLQAKKQGVDPRYYDQLKQLESLYKKGRISAEQYQAAVQTLTSQQKFARDAADAAAKAEKARIEIINEQRKAYYQLVDSEAKRVASMAGENQKIKDEIQLIGLNKKELAQHNIARNESAIAIKEEQLARMQNSLVTTREMAVLEQEIEALKERNELIGRKIEVEEWTESNQAIADEWKRTTEQMEQSLTDALMKGGRSVKEYLKGIFRTLVLRPLLQPVAAGMTGLLMGTSASSALASQGQGGASLLGGLGNFGSLSSLIPSVGSFGGFMGIGSLGSGLQAGLSGLFGEAGLAGTFSAGGAALMSGNVLGGLGTFLGAAAPVLAPLLLFGKQLFGRKHKEHNLQGEFGGDSGFEGNWHDYYKGGLLRRSKTVDTPLDTDTLKNLRQAWKDQESAVKGYADTLGLTTKSIEDFKYAINVKLKDIDPKAGDYKEQVMQRINEAIASGSNEMAQMIIGTWKTVTDEVTGKEAKTYVTSEYAREGETALETLTRLGKSLQTVNAAFDTLDQKLLKASLSSGDLASRIADAFGGLENFSKATSSFYENFYTDAERRAKIKSQLEKQFDDIDMALPETREAYRSLVERVQERMVEGDEQSIQLYATLMQLSDAFAAISPAAESAAQALQNVEFGDVSNLSTAIKEGLIGDLPDAGQAVADLVTSGIYDAISGGFANQITDIFVNGLINPVIQAAMTGSSVAEAVSSAAISDMVSKANAVAAAMNQILNDPAFKEALSSIGAAIKQINFAPYRGGSSYSYSRSVDIPSRSSDNAAKNKYDEAYRALKLAADAEKTRAQKVLEGAKKLEQEFSNLFKYLRTQVRDLRGSVAQTAELQAQQGWSFINDALQTYRDGGVLPKQEELQRAVEAVRKNIDAGWGDSNFERMVLANKLEELQNGSEAALSEQERIVVAAEAQIDALNEMLKKASEQVEYAKGTYQAVMNLADAMRAFDLALGNNRRTSISSYMNRSNQSQSLIASNQTNTQALSSRFIQPIQWKSDNSQVEGLLKTLISSVNQMTDKTDDAVHHQRRTADVLEDAANGTLSINVRESSN